MGGELEGGARPVDPGGQGVQRADPSIGTEVGQSVYLMVLMGAMLSIYIGLGLLAVRVLG
jgi:hypothetical protein